jgi:hypothetical protein
MIGGILREIDARDVGGVIVGRRRDSRAQNLKSVFFLLIFSTRAEPI